MGEVAAQRPEGVRAASDVMGLACGGAAARRPPPVACGDTLPINGRDAAVPHNPANGEARPLPRSMAGKGGTRTFKGKRRG